MSTGTATLALSSATPASCCLITRSKTTTSLLPSKSASFPPLPAAVDGTITIKARRRRKLISCQAVSTASVDNDEKGASVSGSEAEEAEEEAKVGAKVRVKVPLKVYHVPRVPEVDLTGMEGVIKQYVGLWKGKRISANLPFKVEFVEEIEGRGRVKFFAHLREDELEFL